MRRLLVLCLCLSVSACAESKHGDHPPYRVSGLVTVNGKPVKAANVTLYHEGDWGPKPIVPQAWTDQEGHFTLYTYGPNDGAPAGDYRVTVEWFPQRKGKDQGPDALGGKYANRDTSKLTAHIEKGDNKLEYKLEVPEAQVKAVENMDPKSAARGAARRRAER